MIMKSPGRSVEEYREPVETDPPPAPVYSWEQWNADGKVAKAKLDADLAEAQKNYLAKQESAHDTRKAEIKAARALKGHPRQSAEKKAARKWSIKYDENLKEIREIRAKLWKLFYADSAKRKGRYIAARDGTPPTSPPASTTPPSSVTVAAPPPTSPPASTTPPSSVTVAAPPPTSPPASTTPPSSVTVAAPPPIPDLANLPLPPMEPVGTSSIDPGMGPSVGPGGLLVGERYLPTIIINDPDVRPLTNWPLIFGKVGAAGFGIENAGIGIKRLVNSGYWGGRWYGFRVAAPSVLLAAEVGGVVMTGGTILFGGAVVGAVGYGGYKLYKAYKEESRKLGPNARWQDVWHKLIDDSSVPFEIRPPTTSTGRRG